MNGLSIVGMGRSIPEKVVTNEDWSQFVDTDDQWITSRTGIRRRHFVTSESNVDLAADAAKKALLDGGISTKDIGLCIVATFTPDFFMPSVSSSLQARLNLPFSTPCFDLNAACSGFVYALKMAQAFLWSSDKEYALIVGSEVISRVLDKTDRSTCVLFGDGAGATIIKKSSSPFFSVLGTDSNLEALFCKNSSPNHFLQMDGKSVFRFAVDIIPKSVREVVDLSGCELDDIDYIVCHQANERIIKGVSKRLAFPIEKFYMNLQEYGNTSAASIPIALSEMKEKGFLFKGAKVVCVGFGGGLTWGSTYVCF